jgi:hypothetical protein
MRSTRGQHDGSALPERGFDSGTRDVHLDDYVAHISDLLLELQAMATADPHMDLLGRILGLAIDEAARLSDRLAPKQP